MGGLMVYDSDRAEVASAELTSLRREVGALRAALDLREALLHDIDHRTKNTLQVAVAVLDMQRRRSGSSEVREALDRASQRVLAIASAHTDLARPSGDDRVALDRHIERICDALEPADGQRIEKRLASMVCTPSVALPLGLIVSELVINALKYAFPDGRRGVVHVCLEEDPALAEATLRVIDDGVGRSPNRPDGFGSQLIRAFARQIDAEVAVCSVPGEGVTARIRFPWPRRA